MSAQDHMILRNGSHQSAEYLQKRRMNDGAEDNLRNWRLASEIARRCLISGLAEPKQWASDIQVNERTVRAWASGTEPIPKKREMQIIEQGKTYLINYKELDVEIDRMLKNQFGPNVDPGRF